ncbi:O-linked N-acetylglucosamine transferase, SPINDLY family protein [Candidatus Pelagibacter sp.]|uniref:O-linked N-acetylglucosamine transferase, SPINDLY family protein n=1 Tax=Candidatus Pelagibacter sp. TaxID=2024849 RepID=UPI003F83ED4E
MVSIQKLEIKAAELFKKKEYSKVIFEITSETEEKERSAFLCNLLGMSRIVNNKKNKDALILAIKDFKFGYLKEKNTIHAIDSLANFITTSVFLIDLEQNHEFDFTEIFNFYKSSDKFCTNHRPINLAMAMVYRRLNHAKKLIFHFKRVIESKKFNAIDLCNYGYWQCFDKAWSQADFFNYGKFVDQNLKVIPQNQLTEISQTSGSKIRLGFLSSDIIQGHSITYFLKTVLSNYDKNKFEIVLIISGSKEDQSTENFKNLVNETINIFKLSNVDAVNKVRKLKLDFVIDLMGYTSTQRIELFKNRMATKQIVWMGYCNTTGLENMDYLIADPNVIHPNEEKFYSENVIYLPKIWNSHCGYDFKRKENPPPFIKNKYFTFGSFNNFDKINPNVVSTWSKILKKINNSQLVLKTSSKRLATKRLKELFQNEGVLESVKFIDRAEKFKDHLDNYNLIDIALDTFPYNGVTTSFEAIWMGVPVITMAGYNFNSRCGESINKNLNMEQLIASDEDDYIQKVVNLTKNTDDYINIRNSTFIDAIKSPLFNTKDYSKSFFEALEGIAK